MNPKNFFTKFLPNRSRYCSTYDSQTDPAADQQDDQIIQFLTKHPVECGGKIYDINNIWNYTATELERRHNYVPWLFPTNEPSDHNPNAPVLTPTDIRKIRENPRCGVNIMKSLNHMLTFYGFAFDKNTMQIHQKRPEKWPPTPHNYLRITRILKCLSLCGLEETAKAFYDALMSIPNLNETVPQTTLDYWRYAIESYTLDYWRTAMDLQ